MLMLKNFKHLTGKPLERSHPTSRLLYTSAVIATILAGSAFTFASAQVMQSDDARRGSSTTARSIQWETSLDAAEAKAQQNNKPILWVHMLGNIDGYT